MLRTNIKDILKGDTFKVNGVMYEASSDAHQNLDDEGEPWIVYDINNNSWFEEDIDKLEVSNTEIIVQKVCCNHCNAIYYEMPDNPYLQCPHCKNDINDKNKMSQRLLVSLGVDLHGDLFGNVSKNKAVEDTKKEEGTYNITLIDKITLKRTEIKGITNIDGIKNTKTCKMYWGKKYENGNYGVGGVFSPEKYKIIIE